jgi:hypothetical protein
VVVTVKLDFETLLTVPTVPPAAGPDRALAPCFAGAPAAGVVAAGVVACAVCAVAPVELLAEVAKAVP